MSLNLVTLGNDKTVAQKITVATAVTLYTAATGIVAYLDSIYLCNITGGAATIDVFVNDGTSDVYLLKTFSVAANKSEPITDHHVRLRAGWTLKVQTAVADTFDVTAVLVEQETSPA